MRGSALRWRQRSNEATHELLILRLVVQSVDRLCLGNVAAIGRDRRLDVRRRALDDPNEGLRTMEMGQLEDLARWEHDANPPSFHCGATIDGAEQAVNGIWQRYETASCGQTQSWSARLLGRARARLKLTKAAAPSPLSPSSSHSLMLRHPRSSSMPPRSPDGVEDAQPTRARETWAMERCRQWGEGCMRGVIRGA